MTGAEWYLMRATGIVTMILLTAVVALGVATTRRWHAGGLPRWATLALHRNLSLLAVAFIAVHVVTALTDPYAAVGVVNVVSPLPLTHYGLALALGALSLDMLLAVIATSLARRVVGLGAWRGIHLLAYASWPLALWHGLGMGSDAGTPWLVAVVLACVAVVGASVCWRLAAARGALDGAAA